MLALVWVAYLARGERGAAAYVRGSLAARDALPGLSDVDVAVVLQADPGGPGLAAARATARWLRVRRAFALTDVLLDYPLILEHDELRETVDSSALTFGLDGSAEHRAAYFGDRVSQDKLRMLERPGLYTATGDWRLIRGSDRRPREGPRDAQSRRVAAWLELCSWWQRVFPVCADPTGPRTASLCVKLVSEPARIWLWLAHDERGAGREEVLMRALRRLPEDEQALRHALLLLRALPGSPDPPLAEVLPVLLRLSTRIAGLITAETAAEGTTEVRLGGAGPAELILAHGRWRPVQSLAGEREPRMLPLCDWRSLTCPPLPDECFAPLAGEPGDPAVLGAATISQPQGPYPALRADGLMILPAAHARAQLRAIKCAVTDPVSFALAEGRRVAVFPNVSGWSAHDSAKRAVAEHRAWLGAAQASGVEDAEGRSLAMLLSAARAALFAESLDNGGVAELPLTVAETVRRLAARSAAARTTAEQALESYREFATYRAPPPASTVAAMRRLVRQLPAYGERRSPAALSAR